MGVEALVEPERSGNADEEISRFQTYDLPVVVDGGGGHGRIYRISDEDVAKVPHIEREIGREMTMTKMLYESGISVPEPRGWETVRVPDLPKFLGDDGRIILKKGFVMEFVEGLDGKALYEGPLANHERFKLAKQLAKLEIGKAEKLGFVPSDWYNRGNYILTPNDEIKLIDFGFWVHPEVPHVEHFPDRWGEYKFHNVINPEEVFA